MPGKFSLRKFSEINLDDPFFATLKNDYPGNASSPSFSVWFKNKAQEGRTALVFSDDQGLGAFICIKNENEPIELKGGTLAACNRVKISTIANKGKCFCLAHYEVTIAKDTVNSQ